MPDITMCINEGCDKKYFCYRYMTQPSLFQSVSNFGLYKDECDYFWKIQDSSRLSKKKIAEKEEILSSLKRKRGNAKLTH